MLPPFQSEARSLCERQLAFWFMFFLLFLKILPLYVLILLGIIAGKKLNVKKESVASLLIYSILPIVVFNSIVATKINCQLLFLPIIFFICCSSLCLLFYVFGGKLFKDNTRNILAFTAGTANTGYFGIPVAVELFGEKSLGIIVLCILGFTFFENSLGFFITAKGNHSAKEAIMKLIKLPTIYAFILGLIANHFGFSPGENYTSLTKHFLGAYTTLGMMLIGLGLADMKSFKLDLKFLVTAIFAKFIAWPLLISFIVFIDNNYFKIFDNSVHNIMLLLSIVPLAANTVAFATELKVQPEKAALAVFISTLIALVYIPLLTIIFIK